jgi:hypothetical protein
LVGNGHQAIGKSLEIVSINRCISIPLRYPGLLYIESMLERDLQDYLFENPDVLFPDQVIQRKRREVSVGGRRIDLLFEVDGVQYIIELKRDTIRREDIGQVFEYYGLIAAVERDCPLQDDPGRSVHS